jgi:crossover junction endodeoxyribonuclease RusA
MQQIATFVVLGEPVSKQRARIGRNGGVYTPTKTQQAEEAIGWAFRSAVRGWRPLADREYLVDIQFFLKSGQRRDVDNMVKTVLDGLNKIAWVDDSQVAEIHAQRTRLDPNPRTVITVFDVGEGVHPTAVCIWCRKEYRTYPSWSRKFCSEECRSASLREKRLRTCEQCGVQWDSKAARPNARFCSRKCASEAGRVAVTCEVCKTSFSKQKSWAERNAHHFCSPECRQKYWRPRRASRAAGTCADCGGPTTKKAYRRCAACVSSGVSGRPRTIIGEPWTTSPLPTEHSASAPAVLSPLLAFPSGNLPSGSGGSAA